MINALYKNVAWSTIRNKTVSDGYMHLYLLVFVDTKLFFQQKLMV